ncbi:MAG: PilZ domain-containing protein [Novosphingobium sp.]
MEMPTDTARGAKVTPIGATRIDPSGIRHRSAERFTLMLRVAKLVGSHGEYACVIRDVSATGVRLRLFHDLPAEKHLALVLGNGETYFIETVWEREREAGFQFSAPIEVTAFMQETSKYPRRQVRLALELPATLSIREFSTAILIRDLSQHGARIESERALAEGQHFRLKAHNIPEIFASVRWKKDNGYGIVFQQGFKLDELATLVWKLHEPAERMAAIRLREAASALPPGHVLPAAHLRAG